ncbi:MAG: hypothetical protein R3F56_09375 [Planctomycetota bacterium]
MTVRALSLLFLVSALPAQTALNFEPQGALATFELDGPARWRTRFAGTKLGDLLASKRFAELWAPVTAKIDDLIAKAQKESQVDQRATYDAVLAYGGRVRVVLFVRPPANADAEPSFHGYVAAGPDGTSDLPAAAKFVHDQILSEGKPFEALNIGGAEWLAAGIGGDSFTTVPQMVGDHLTMLFGLRSDLAALEGLFADGAAPAPMSADGPAVEAHCDGKQLLQLLASVEDDSEQVMALMAGMGANDIGDVTFRAAPLERFTELTFEIQTGRRTGFMEVLFPTRDKPPALLALVPRAHPSYYVVPVGSQQLVAAIEQVLSAMPDAPGTFADVEADVVDAIGVRLGDDLLAHVGDEAIWLTAVDADLDPDTDMVSLVAKIFDGYCLGVALRDGAAFGRTVEKMLEAGDLLRMRKTEKYRDVDVHRLSVPAMRAKIHWTITDDLAVVAFGERGLANLQGLLDGAAARARGEALGAFAKSYTERLAVLPPGHCSVSFETLTDMLDLWTTFLVIGAKNAARPPEFDVEMVTRALADVRDLLRVHDLAHTLTVTYQGADSVVQRTIW